VQGIDGVEETCRRTDAVKGADEFLGDVGTLSDAGEDELVSLIDCFDQGGSDRGETGIELFAGFLEGIGFDFDATPPFGNYFVGIHFFGSEEPFGGFQTWKVTRRWSHSDRALMIMTRPLSASKLIFALLCAIAWVGCSERVSINIQSETEDPVYRRAKDLLARNLHSEALSNFEKLIMMRDGNAPESHLEVGLIFLDHMKDPVSAIYHFKRYQALRGRESKSPQLDASLERVDDLEKTAMKELLSTLEAQVYRSKLLSTIEQLRAENESLRDDLVKSRKRILEEAPSEVAQRVDGSALGNRAEPRRPGGSMSTPRERRLYVVKPGDSLYNISREVYGDGGRYKEILKANQATLPSANQLQPGMSLIIP